MTAQPQQPVNMQLALQLPTDQEAGTYANFASIWRDSDGFILDFAVYTMPPQQHTDEATGQSMGVLNCKIVSRVRIPPGQAWEFMKGLTAQLDQWEQEHGKIGPAPPAES